MWIFPRWVTRQLMVLAGLSVAYLGYRGDPNAEPQRKCRPSPNDPDHQVYPSAPPVVKTVELSDEGELLNRCQFTGVMYELNKVPGPEVVVLYIHGWKHSASPGDSDRAAFKRFIGQLTTEEKASEHPRRVVGVFVAWRGLTLAWPVLRELTFWRRKAAADKISQAAGVTKLLGAMHNARRLQHQSRDLMVFMGHSFGARLLFTAVGQVILYDVQMQHPGRPGGTYGRISSPADIIVLLNPAFEASTYSALDAMRRSEESFAPDQQPVMLTISTDNDWATRYAFPVGQWLALDRQERRLQTLGNWDPFVTHSFYVASGADKVLQSSRSGPWYDHYCAGGVCLGRVAGDLQPSNPFLVARTTSWLLNGHNGIWQDRFVDWLRAFIHQVDAHRSADTLHLPNQISARTESHNGTEYR